MAVSTLTRATIEAEVRKSVVDALKEEITKARPLLELKDLKCLLKDDLVRFISDLREKVGDLAIITTAVNAPEILAEIRKFCEAKRLEPGKGAKEKTTETKKEVTEGEEVIPKTVMEMFMMMQMQNETRRQEDEKR